MSPKMFLYCLNVRERKQLISLLLNFGSCISYECKIDIYKTFFKIKNKTFGDIYLNRAQASLRLYLKMS